MLTEQLGATQPVARHDSCPIPQGDTVPTSRGDIKQTGRGFPRPAIRFPRECRLAGILNLGSERPLSCRFRFAHWERSQQRRLWAAAGAN